MPVRLRGVTEVSLQSAHAISTSFGGTAEPAGAFDADDSAATVKMDPVPPYLAFMAGFKVRLAESFKKFGDGARFLRAGDDKLGFHGVVRESLRGWCRAVPDSGRACRDAIVQVRGQET